MSDYFQQLSQQTGICAGMGFTADRQSAGLGGVPESPQMLSGLETALPEIEETTPSPSAPLSEPFQLDRTLPPATQPIPEASSLEIQPNLDMADAVAENLLIQFREVREAAESHTELQAETWAEAESWSKPQTERIASRLPESSEIEVFQEHPIESKNPDAVPSTPAPEAPLAPQLTLQAVRDWLTAAPNPTSTVESPGNSNPSALAFTPSPQPSPDLNPMAMFLDTPTTPTTTPAPPKARASEPHQTQDFTLAIGSINLTIEAPPTDLPQPPAIPATPTPVAVPTRLSRYYLRVP